MQQFVKFLKLEFILYYSRFRIYAILNYEDT